MDEYLYNSMSSYFNILEKVGYANSKLSDSLLVFIFYYHLLNEDYRGRVSKDDYRLIEKALNCLYGTTCLTPYPEYLKMGKLHKGDLSELAQRVQNLEDTEVLKLQEGADEESDITIEIG
jgi:hypothetical protein